MTDQTLKPDSLKTAGRGAAQKIGRQPEGAARSELTMLKVAERPQELKATHPIQTQFSDYHKAAVWLDDEITKTKKTGVSTQVVELTTALASVLLERNPNNRNINPNLVESYARDIEHGKWRLNGEPIIVASDGHLNDGQHRCSAVVAADMSIQSVLIVGVSRDTRTTLDQGRARTVGDYLAMDGHINTNNLGTAASFIWQHRTRGTLANGGSGKPTKSEIMALIEEFPSIEESVKFVQMKGADAYGGKSMLAFCHWTFWHTADQPTANDFVVKMVGGAGLLAKDPILYTRNRLVAERGRLRTNDKAELLFRTWNSWRRREMPRVLPILGGVLPVVEK